MSAPPATPLGRRRHVRESAAGGYAPRRGEVYLGDRSPGDVKASHRLRMRRDASPCPTGTEGHPHHCDENGQRDAHEGTDDMDDGGGTVHEASASFPKA